MTTAWIALDDQAPILREAPGEAPLLLCFPQSGRGLPPALAARMTAQALALPDTCWHVDALWRGVVAPDVGWMMPAFSRLLIDCNRQPEPPLLPIANATPICAVATFGGAPVYRDGMELQPAEIADRIASHWQPFHARLAQRLADAARRHGHAVLLDAHSIGPTETRFLGRVPPPVAVKTGNGACCTPALVRAVAALVARHAGLGIECDVQAKGGFILHRHARLAEGISAVHIEVRQDLYMDPTRPARPIAPGAALTAFLRDALASLG